MIYIGLGTNLGDRNENLKKARLLISSHENIKILKESSVLETEPVDFLDQPAFLNQIIAVNTYLSPENLLRFLQSIELNMGKKVIFPKGPRLIDLDILLYNNLILTSSDLEIPHPGIKKRDFILKHLVELDVELRDPVSDILYREV
ncbi:MAG: 2-amino-4-hydroxy-6-hydroxymethyldihydropteridine diphosphokinase [Bacteroidales bacterium]|jgi:2-amino-4-hydroxy-6-hydroxymethyldihydropteridine diphosphokinase|nr:2-amino-4-hydroxy-6-hydroxymethyldihydropteridine diphosphokinase [Bacteroidales bacterium]